MFDKMKDLMEMKRQADKIKRELDSATVETQDIKGIRIVITGSQNIRLVEISDEKMADKGRLEQDLAKSFNSAVKKSQLLAAQKMKDVMPGFPGL